MRTLPLSAALILGTSLQAATYWVSTSGSDQAPGTQAQPWLTLQHAANTIAAGDTVQVGTGLFQGFNLMDLFGDAQHVTVFQGGGNAGINAPCAYNGLDGINVENCSWVHITGFTVNDMPRTGIRSALTDHVTISHNTCTNNYKWGILTGFAEHVIIEHNHCSGSQDEHGIYFSNSADDPIIRYNECFNNNANGIHMNGDLSMGGDGVISNAQVYGNVIHGNGAAGGSGINCDGVVNSVFYNNLLFDNHASGISLYQIDGGAPSTGNRVYNNTIINASDARWCVNITDGCTGNQLLNNILINDHPWRGSIVVAADALTGFISDHNLVTPRLSPDGDATILDLAEWQALGYDAASQVADGVNALFADAASDNYQALDASSQQVDAGTAGVSAVVNVDLIGAPRPLGAAYDIGCFEFQTNVGVAERKGLGTLAVREGRLLVRQAPLNSTLVVHDALGRTLLQRTITGDAVLELPAVAWLLVVLRDGEGAPLASERAVGIY